jgi:hypothetical protein
MECELGTWTGRLSWTSFFSPEITLTDCASGEALTLGAIDFSWCCECNDGGMFEMTGRLCQSASGESILDVDAYVGPCEGTCEALGTCEGTAGECLDDYIDCDLRLQDCPRGEKCAPWVVDGGPYFIGATCRAVDPNPDGLGEPCTASDDGDLGHDSCDVGLLCWEPEPLGERECIEICAPDGQSSCENGDACWACPTLPSLGLCLPPGTELPIAHCAG